jgi:hypothetical protein
MNDDVTRWLTWEPQVFLKIPESEPTKPTKPVLMVLMVPDKTYKTSFDGFDGSTSENFQKIGAQSEKETQVSTGEQSKPCFHCDGLEFCDCILCNTGLALEDDDFKVKPGRCVACRRKARQ